MTGEPGAIAAPSPNEGARRDGARPDMIVLHYTAMKTAEAARDWLCTPESQVSAHYLVGRDGTLWQLVCESRRAWHAGAGAWGDVTDVNSRSIGIELDNDGGTPFSAPLMDRLGGLLRGVMARWDVPLARVVGHSDTAPGRKIDPGPRFDWDRLARQGLAIRPEQTRAGDFFADLRTAGYCWPEGGEEAALRSFRMRFRPAASDHDGGPDDTDAALAAGLARDYPCEGRNGA